MTQFLFRRGTAAAAASNNVLLAAGEPGFESDALRLKVGDGATHFAALPYLVNELERTAVKTAAYAAKPSDLVPVDISAGNVPITLPTAPPDRTRIAAETVAISSTPGSTSMTVTCGGSDVFDTAAGATVKTFTALHQGAIFQYDKTSAVWSLTATHMPLGSALGAGKVGADGYLGTPGQGGTGLTRLAAIDSQPLATIIGRNAVLKGKPQVSAMADAPPLAQGPALTLGAGFASGSPFVEDLSQSSLPTHNVAVQPNDSRIFVSGGPMYAAIGGSVTYGVMQATPPNFVGVGTKVGLYKVRFDGQVMEVLLQGNGSPNITYLKVWATENGHLKPHANTAMVIPWADTNLHLLRIAFPTSAIRDVLIEGTGLKFGGFRCGITDTISSPPRGGPRVLIAGASYECNAPTGTVAGFLPYQAWIWRAFRKLGIEDIHQAAFGGTGYLATASGTAYTMLGQLQALNAQNNTYAAIYVGGQRNDSTAGYAGEPALDTAIEAFYNWLLENFPNTPILSDHPYTTIQGTAYDAENATIAGQIDAAITAIDDPMLFPAYDPISAIPLTGTGYYGALQHDGNSDVNTAGDGAHYQVRGGKALAEGKFKYICETLDLNPETSGNATAPAITVPGLATPIECPGGQPAANANPANAGEIYAVRVICPFGGTLEAIAAFMFLTDNGGNYRLGVYDTGDAADDAGTRTLLYDSGSIAMPASTPFAWEVVGTGGGGAAMSIPVYGGQQLDFVLMQDDNVAKWGTAFTNEASPQHILPSGWNAVPGGASPKLAWAYTPGAYGAFPATVTEAECTNTGPLSFVIIGQIV